MTEEKFRELVQTGEGTRLDYKRDMYGDDARGKADLAKDLMTMANVPSPNSPPAYMLIGVDETEAYPNNLHGVNRADLLDEAVYRQKVKDRLNRVPTSSFDPFEHDGNWYGVFAIQPGGRPFYALTNSPPLQRRIAEVRDGKNCDVATPDDIVAWFKEDNAVELELQRLQLEQARAVNEIHPVVRSAGASRGGNGVSFNFHVEDAGEGQFRLTSATFTAELTESFYTAYRKHHDSEAPTLEPLNGAMSIGWHGLIQTADSRQVDFKVTPSRLNEHLRSQGAKEMQGLSHVWLMFEVAFEFEGRAQKKLQKYSVPPLTLLSEDATNLSS